MFELLTLFEQNFRIMIVQKPFSLSVLDKSKEGLFVNFAEFSGIAEDGFYNLSIDDWIS